MKTEGSQAQSGSSATSRVRWHHLWLWPNVMSLLRVVLIAPVVLCLVQDAPRYTTAALVLLAVAAATDFLDGFLARRLNQQTELGLILDPLADKVLAIALLVTLVFTRSFPLWAASLIIGRDLLIILAGIVLSRKLPEIPPSDTIGKYYFSVIAALLISYVIDFSHGKSVFMAGSIVLLAVSLFNYGYSFVRLLRTGRPSPLGDHRVVVWALRLGFWSIVGWSLWHLAIA
jgi:CDP-diacylglycerol--glycerol-3-phosphate 3-phosphatidyltransferase